MRVGIPVADLTAGLFAALGILVALLERDSSGKGQAVETSLLQAQIFMLDFQAARYLVEGEVAGAGRQQSSDQHSDRRVQDLRRLHQHGRHRPAKCGSGCAVAARRRPRCWTNAELSHRRVALEESRRAQRRDRRAIRDRHQRRMGRAAQQGRRAVRADLFDRPDVRRPAGQASRHRRERQHEDKGKTHDASARPAGVAVAHALASRSAGRRRPANTPTPCSRSSAFPNARSRRCMRRRRFNFVVMAGLVPAIHVLLLSRRLMPGTSRA